jgi:hypothetical protein
MILEVLNTGSLNECVGLMIASVFMILFAIIIFIGAIR